MGQIIEFNWVLKLKPEQGMEENSLKKGKTFKFEKQGTRAYPVNLPIDLLNQEWEAIAKVEITRVEWQEGKTTGEFNVLRCYTNEEKKLLTKLWRENVDLITKTSNTDYSKVKLT